MCVVPGRALGLQEAVIQQVPGLLRGEGGTFAFDHTELAHHAEGGRGAWGGGGAIGKRENRHQKCNRLCPVICMKLEEQV